MMADGPPPCLDLQQEEDVCLDNSQWRLLWCHERCHKQESEGLRAQIQRGAQQYGGAIICLKKARQFAVWMERGRRPSYILTTDWREAQPCIQAILDHTGGNRPLTTVVICDSTRQASRAQEWARGLTSAAGRVLACERADIPPGLLNGLIMRCFGPPLGPMLGPAPPAAAAGRAAVPGSAPGGDLNLARFLGTLPFPRLLPAAPPYCPTIGASFACTERAVSDEPMYLAAPPGLEWRPTKRYDALTAPRQKECAPPAAPPMLGGLGVRAPPGLLGEPAPSEDLWRASGKCRSTCATANGADSACASTVGSAASLGLGSFSSSGDAGAPEEETERCSGGPRRSHDSGARRGPGSAGGAVGFGGSVCAALWQQPSVVSKDHFIDGRPLFGWPPGGGLQV